ncbi:unnamed protein product [Parajaminaea phylloscopi]
MESILPSPKQDAREEATQAIRAYVAEAFEAGSLPPPLAHALRTRSITLLDTIKLLGEYLTSEDERTRSKGVELLAQIVIDLAPSDDAGPSSAALFDRQAVRTLSGFLAEKLEDGTNVAASIAKATNSADKVVPGSAPSFRFKAVPEGAEMLACSVRALTMLARLEGFGSEQARNVASSLISHVKPRDFPQAVRFMIYALLDVLISRHRAVLKAMGKTFLKGYVDLAEGEKDPRNLMYLFAMDRVILIEWDLADMAEAFFDITYCYFPITFRPPPDDPYGITTEDLKLSLRSCLVANPLLAPHAMPLLLEKLGASGGNTKRDTLETLEAAMPVFGKAAVLAHEKKLWEGFKVEIMAATDEETSRCAQKALASFFWTLYHDVESPDGIAPRALSDALQELEEPEKSLAQPACDLLVSMVKSCSSVAHVAMYAFLDQMLGMFKNPDAATVRGPILACIARVLEGMTQVYQRDDHSKEGQATGSAPATAYKFDAPASSTSSQARTISIDAAQTEDIARPAERSYDGDKRPLDPVRDELLSALSNGVRSTQYRASALLAFVHLTHVPTFLSSEETNYIAESVNELILSPGAEDVRGAALDGLRDIARVNPRVLEETTLPLLFARLPDRMPSHASASSDAELKGVVRRVLGSLARLCVQPDLFDLLSVRLSTKLDLVCASEFSTAAEREANVGYARGLLVTLLTILQEKTARAHADVSRYGIILPPRLFALILAAALRSGHNGPLPVAVDPRVVNDIGRLLSLLVRSLNSDKQTELASWLNAAFVEGKIGGPLETTRLTEASKFQPFDSTAASQQKDTAFAFASALVALRKEVTVGFSSPNSLPQNLQRLLSFTVSASNKLQADAGYILLATTVNKHAAEPLPSSIEDLLSSFWSEEVVPARGGHDDRRCRAIWAWFWLTKALLVRNSKSGQVLLEKALDHFLTPQGFSEDAYAAKDAARALGLVASDDDGVLSKDNGAVVRLLYRQKFYSHLLPRIVAGHANATQSASADNGQDVHLIAMAAILPSMPRQMIQDRLGNLFPLLITALDLPDASARTSAATTITLAAALGKKTREEAIRQGQDHPASSLDLVQEHFHTLVERLLCISRPTADSPAAVRIEALRCLATMVRCLPSTTTQAEQSRVLRALNGPGMGVDDPKKEVRTEAVDCKAAWHIA